MWWSAGSCCRCGRGTPQLCFEPCTSLMLWVCVSGMTVSACENRQRPRPCRHPGEGLDGCWCLRCCCWCCWWWRRYLRVVKLTLLGSIIGNLLLVMGSAFIAGGLVHSSQTFNQQGINVNCGLLILSGGRGGGDMLSGKRACWKGAGMLAGGSHSFQHQAAHW